jgi:hypothetical protein
MWHSIVMTVPWTPVTIYVTMRNNNDSLRVCTDHHH